MVLFKSELLIFSRGNGEVGSLLSEECYSTESRLMIITGLITLGVSVAFWCVVSSTGMVLQG